MAENSRSQLLTDALAMRASSADSGEFAILYERIAPSLHAWASCRIPASLRARLAPEDLVQEVWIRAMLKIADFDAERGRFRQWIFGFARNVLFQALRHRMTSASALGGADAAVFSMDGLPAEVTAITQRVSRDERAQKLAARLTALGESDQRLLLLRGLEGRDHDAVAADLGIEAPALRKRWQRLRSKLGQDEAITELLAD